MKMFQNKKGTLFVVILLAVFWIALPAASHAAKIQIKLTTIQRPTQQMGKACIALGKRITEAFGDQVNMKVFPSAQLYRGKEELEALIRGEIQMAFVIGSRLESIDPALQFFKLPYLFETVEEAYKVVDGPLAKELFKKLEARNLKVFSIVNSGNPVFSNSERPLKWPKDFEGLKLRSYGRMGKDTLAFLGATAVVTPSSETFSAVQTGVIDGVMTPNSVYLKRKYNTIQKYVTDGGLVNFTNTAFLVNLEFWNSLPDDIRSTIEKFIKEMTVEMRKEMKVENKKIFGRIEASGNQVHYLTPEQVAAWKKSLEPIYDKYGPEIGEDLIRSIREHTGK